jgi:hypothetical protein
MLGGCGGDDDSGDEPGTVTETVTEAEDTASTQSTDATTTVQDIPAAKTGPRYFETPSSNIGCFLDSTGARCDIRERNWDPPPSNEDCELDYGQGIALGLSGEADFVCAGDTTLGGPVTLAYGSSAQRGTIRCQSRPKGITCTELRSGHGFFLSRQSYRIF